VKIPHNKNDLIKPVPAAVNPNGAQQEMPVQIFLTGTGSR
jgi:hypothetical protein